MKKVLFFPDFKNTENQFINVITSIINYKGYEVIYFEQNIKELIKHQKEYIAVFLNWYERIDFWNGFNLEKNILKKKLLLLLCRMFGIKIVFTFHNRISHDIKENTVKKNKKLLRWICHYSDYIIILSINSRTFLFDYLSEKEINKKVKYIPHPNYIGVYSNEISYYKFVRNKKFKILFVGLIRPYKNIELILKVAESFEYIDFTIAGKCEDKNYENEIKDLAHGLDNVYLEFNFLDNKELIKKISSNDIILLPYDMKSSLNSGTAMLAFSCGRTVICPKISTILEYDEKNLYSYVYNSSEEHLQNIMIQVENAYNDWQKNIEVFEEKGINMFFAVKKYNSINRIMTMYNDLLDEIESGNCKSSNMKR